MINSKKSMTVYFYFSNSGIKKTLQLPPDMYLCYTVIVMLLP